MVVLLFWCFTLCTCAIAALKGGRDGRIAAAMIMVAVLLTAIAEALNLSWRSVNLGVMMVDTLLLVGLIALMLKSNRYWPIWMAAAQSLTVGTHIGTMIVSRFNPNIYAALATGASIICLACMAMGVLLDWRASIGTAGHDSTEV